MSEVQTVADYFGCNVFSDKVMRDRLPKNIYKSVMNTKNLVLLLMMMLQMSLQMP